MRAMWIVCCLGLFLAIMTAFVSARSVILHSHIIQPYTETMSQRFALSSSQHGVDTELATHTLRGRGLTTDEPMEVSNGMINGRKHEHRHHITVIWERLKHGLGALAGHHFRREHAEKLSGDTYTVISYSPSVNSSIDPLEEKGLPSDFDWKAYVALHPDIQQAGIASQEAAQQHYLEFGRQEGRLFKLRKIILHYTACGGLTNQIYSHIPAFVLCAALGAELVLPPALMRSSFGHHSHEIVWSSGNIGLLLDTDNITEEWQGRGMSVLGMPASDTLPALATPDMAWPTYQASGEDERYTVRIDSIYHGAWELQNLTQRIYSAVAEQARQLYLQDPDSTTDHMNVYLPCTMFMLQTVSDEEKNQAAEAARALHYALALTELAEDPLAGVRADSEKAQAAEAAKTLRFAPALIQLADKVLAGMEASGLTPFNALHLRIERDVKDWTEYMGGEEDESHCPDYEDNKRWTRLDKMHGRMVKLVYGKAMHEAGFNSSIPLYIGSGLKTYGADEEVQKAEDAFLSWGLGLSVHTKEMYLTDEELAGLASEQKAVVDFLVLARGFRFVGLGFSSFSYYLRQYRVLQGLPYDSSVLIAGHPLFHQAGTVVNAT